LPYFTAESISPKIQASQQERFMSTPHHWPRVGAYPEKPLQWPAGIQQPLGGWSEAAMNAHVHPVMAQVLNTAAAAAVPAPSIDALEVELRRETAALDPAYVYSDDHSYWRQHHERAQRMARLQRDIAHLRRAAA
jgi:hypothetical protein